MMYCLIELEWKNDLVTDFYDQSLVIDGIMVTAGTLNNTLDTNLSISFDCNIFPWKQNTCTVPN